MCVVCCTQCGESLAAAAEARPAEAELLNVVRVDVVRVHHRVQLVVVRVEIELSPRHTQKTHQHGDEDEATHSEGVDGRRNAEGGGTWLGDGCSSEVVCAVGGVEDVDRGGIGGGRFQRLMTSGQLV